MRDIHCPKKLVSIIGSTGSVGTSAIEVILLNKDLFKVNYLVAKKDYKKLAQQAILLEPEFVLLEDEAQYSNLSHEIDLLFAKKFNKPQVLVGKKEIDALILENTAETIVFASSGTDSIHYFLSMLKTSKIIAIANKESIVCGGDLLKTQIHNFKGTIIPVDSEHSAIYQCLLTGRKDVSSFLLTASGGPFFNLSDDELKNTTKEDALKHPSWSMGNKITIDSATLVNKGLEMMEASYLFDIPIENIDVVIHPQSIIHGAVTYKDGTMVANMYNPSMKIPVAYALSYPNRIATSVEPLSLSKLANLKFYEPLDRHKKLFNIVKNVVKTGGNFPCIFNTANEVLVEAFLANKISFIKILSMLEYILDVAEHKKINSVEDLLLEYLNTKINVSNYIKDCT